MLLVESLLAAGTIPTSPLLFLWGSGQTGQLANATNNGIPDDTTSVRSWSSMAYGYSHVVALRSDGLLFTWGTANGNNFGQLGLGTTITEYSPTQVGTSSWLAVAAGRSHSLAIRSNGTLFAWGQNSVGELGLNDTNDRSSPTQIGTSSWTALGRSEFWSQTSAAIRQDGRLFMWGQGTQGQLGNGNAINRSSPTQVGTSSWTQVASAVNNTMAIRQGGTLFGWGSQSGGKLGNYINGTTPPSMQSWRSISASEYMTAGIDSNFKLWTWGYNVYGGLGLGDTIDRSSPVQVGTSSWTLVRATQYGVWAIRSNGQMFTWGYNQVGQLGLGDTIHRSSPTQMGTSSWIAVSAVADRAAMLRLGGSLFLTGNDSYNMAQDPAGSQNRSSPLQVGTSSWSSVAMNFYQIWALKSGQLWTWGNNQYGMSGLWDSSINNWGGTTVSWTQLSASDDNVFAAITNTNELWMWGNTSYGVTTNGDSLKIVPGAWSQIEISRYSVLALKTDSTLWAWGRNNDGQLGLDDIIDRSSPTQIGTSSWIAIANNESSSAAIRQDGKLFTWGNNTSGKLGLGDFDKRSSPTQMGTSNWSAVAFGHSHGAGIRQGGTLFTWGSNSYGELGLFSTDIYGQPVRTYGIPSWSSIGSSLSDGFFYGLQGTTLVMWGSNTSGQLGQGTTFHATSNPVSVPGSWISVSGGYQTMYGVKAGGTLWSWGADDQGGALGLGSSNDYRSSPTQIGTSLWTFVRAGRSSAAAIRQDGRLFTWGNSDYGVLGEPGPSRSSPVQLGTSSWVTVSFSNSGAMAIRHGGSLFTWGINNQGQIGNFNSAGAMTNWTQWVQIVGGQQFGAARTNLNQLFVWGANNYGQLGQGDRNARSSPVLVPGSWTSITAGYESMKAVRQGGALFTWGNNFYGELGLSDNASRSSPTQVGTSSWVTVGGGSFATHTMAIRSGGTLFTWGANNFGQLGLGDQTNRNSPTQVGTSSWSAVNSSDRNSYAIRSQGTLFAWGDNSNGQIGNGTTTNSSSPVQIGSSSWVAVSTNQGFRAWAIRQGGSLFGWGAGGSLGTNDYNARSSPTQIGTSSWISLASGSMGGNDWAGAIRSDGTLFTWGGSYYGATTRSNYVLSPTAVGAGYSLVGAIGSDTAMAVSNTGLMYVWGSSWNGVWGLNNQGDFNQYYTPQPWTSTNVAQLSPVQIGSSSWTFVAAGDSQNFAIRQGGTLFGWGSNFGYALGIGGSEYGGYSSPQQVGTSSWTAVANSGNYGGMFGIRQGGTLMAWGNPYWTNNKAGTATSDTYSSPVIVGDWPQPQPNPLFGKSFVFVSSSQNITGPGYQVETNGTAWGGGYSDLAILRTAYTSFNTVVAPSSSASPLQIGTDSWTVVNCGSAVTFAGASQGSARYFSTGSNYFGALGQGIDYNSVYARSYFYQMSGGYNTDTSRLKLRGKNYSFGMNDQNNYLLTWGYNNQGQLGQNSQSDVNAPNYTANYQQFAKIFDIATGGSIGVDVYSPTVMYWWGSYQANPMHQVLNQYSNKLSPVQVKPLLFNVPNQVGTASDWNLVTAADLFVMAKRTNTVYGWGYNSQGQLGLNDTNMRSSPAQVSFAASSSTADFMMGNGQTWWLTTTNQLWASGQNSQSRLGVNDTINRSSPVQITSPDATWTGLANMALGNSMDAFAFKGTANSFTALSWGRNFYGNNLQPFTFTSTPQFVDATIQVSPVQIGTASWLQVSSAGQPTTGASQWSVGRQSNGYLYTWGSQAGTDGVLGLGTTVNTIGGSPVLMSNSSYTFVSAGWNTGLAVKNDGTMVGWGVGATGQFGDYVTAPSTRSVPLTAASGSWTQVNIGFYASAGIGANNWLWTWGLAGTVGTLGGQGYSPYNITTVNPQLVFDNVAESPTQLGTLSWRQISNKGAHTLAISSDGSLWAWGWNANGQLGNGSSTPLSSPTQIGTSKWAWVAAGITHSVAIRQGGTLFTWGLNNFGQLGLGDVTGRSSPTQVGSSSWTQVAAADNISAAIRQDGTLWTWGYNPSGQLGLSDIIYRSSPAQVGTSSWTLVTMGNSSTSAIGSDGTLWSWGGNYYGQLGLDDLLDRSSPTQVGTSSWIAVSMGRSHALAVRRDTALTGRLFAWGYQLDGALGAGAVQEFTATQVANGTASTLTIDTNGKLWGWGNDAQGNLGLGSTGYRSNPSAIAPDKNFAKVAAGPDGACSYAIDTNGKLWSWGNNDNGSLGVNDTINRSSPVQVGNSNWLAVAAGYRIAYAIRQDGRLFSWGRQQFGESGLSDNVYRSSPTQVGTSNWTAVYAYYYQAAAIRQDGRLFAWGYNPYGGLGLGDAASRSSPTQVGTSSWVAVGLAFYAMTAIRQGGSLFSTGYNQYGELGLNDTINRSSPTQIGALTWNLLAPVNSQYSTAAQTTDGTLWAWGQNNNYQLGNGSVTQRSSPVQVSTSLKNWSAINGYSNGYVAVNNNIPYGWGPNTNGVLDNNANSGTFISPRQLGIPFAYAVRSPIQVGTRSWRSVSAGNGTSAAIDADELLYTWGRATNGGLGGPGAGSLVSRSSPVQLGTSTWSSVSLGDINQAGITK